MPTEIGLLKGLTYLDLERNHLQGKVSTEIGLLKDLTFLNLKNNVLSVPLFFPKLLGLHSLEFVRGSKNRFTGTIPHNIDEMTNLQELWMGDNLLSGILTNDIGSLTNLIHVNTSNTNLEGTVPSLLFELSTLTIFDLWDHTGHVR